tara:strand:- start:2556 stop:2786 length:231 start_codon:yes stop_codon:yes gene_type:complete
MCEWSVRIAGSIMFLAVAFVVTMEKPRVPIVAMARTLRLAEYSVEIVCLLTSGMAVGSSHPGGISSRYGLPRVLAK